jgi:hypothetical protein
MDTCKNLFWAIDFLGAVNSINIFTEFLGQQKSFSISA